MGIHGLNRGLSWYGLSLTLGGGEVTLLDMTNAYSTFANGGVEVDANPILKIEDPQGRIINCNAAYTTRGGECSSTQQQPFAQGNGQVLDPRNAYMMTSILTDNRARSSAFGVNNPLHMSFPAAAKTGTTDDNRDSWTMGYTPNLAVGVWVGNSNNAQMLKVTGAIGAAVIWHNMMDTFYNNKEFVDLVRNGDGSLQTDFVQPPGLIKTSACSQKGTITDLFLKDKPPQGCTTYKDKNPQLHSAPSDKPTPKPTPLPGIWPPLHP
jgi:membrane peptidoglycan carboxypeptidase